MDIRTFNANEPTSTTQSTMESLGPPPATINNPAQENSVNDHSPSQQTGGNHVPTDGAREATTPKPPTALELEQLADERLSASPEYRELAAKLEALKAAEIDFALVDEHTLGAGDNIISIQDLRVLIADPFSDPGAKAAAQRLMNNKALWNELASGVTGINDNKVGANDIGRLKGDTQAAISSMRNDVRSEIKAEFAPKAPAAQSPGSSPISTNQQGATGPSVESQVQRLPPSTLPGIDGATENLSIGADYLQGQMMALAQEASDHPEKAALNAQKIATLQNQFQALTNMMNQLSQMMSNMSKMWSDVAMNSIRNLK